MALPIRHRLNHEPVLVLHDDDAWDNERVERELDQISKGEESPWPTMDDHPWSRYIAGVSRYDLSTVKDYLDESKAPLKFVLRRLKYGEFCEMQNLWRREEFFRAHYHAVRNGLVSIEGCSDFDLKRTATGALTDGTIEELRECLGEEVITAIARAVQAVSIGLSDLEKKL